VAVLGVPVIASPVGGGPAGAVNSVTALGSLEVVGNAAPDIGLLGEIVGKASVAGVFVLVVVWIVPTDPAALRVTFDEDVAVAAAAELLGGWGGCESANAPPTNCHEHASVNEVPGGWPGAMLPVNGRGLLDPPTVVLVAGTSSIAGKVHSYTS